MRVLLVTGGTTSERKISLLSAKEVRTGLESKGYKVTLFDLKKGFLSLKEKSKDIDIIFPILHGKDGEDGTLYKALHQLKIPFVGQDCVNTEIAFDKIMFKHFCKDNNLPTAEWRIVKNKNDILDFGLPCVLKAARGGSSKEVALLKIEKDLGKSHVKKILQLKDKLFVEELISGVEITVGVLIDKALPVIEIIPPNDGWFDYKNKYSGKSNEIVGAPSIGKKIQQKAKELALFIHTKLQLGPYSRLDMIVSKNQELVILEVNSPCGVGMTSMSLFPKAAKEYGLDFPDLAEKLVLSTLT